MVIKHVSTVKTNYKIKVFINKSQNKHSKTGERKKKKQNNAQKKGKRVGRMHRKLMSRAEQSEMYRGEKTKRFCVKMWQQKKTKVDIIE